MEHSGLEEVIDLVSSDDSSDDAAAEAPATEDTRVAQAAGPKDSDVEIIDLLSSDDSDDQQADCVMETKETTVKLEVAKRAAAIQTYSQREKALRKIRRKNNPWPSKLSRKPARIARRTPTVFMQQYPAVPGVREALQQLQSEIKELQQAPQLMPRQEKSRIAEEQKEAVGGLLLQEEEVQHGAAGDTCGVEEKRKDDDERYDVSLVVEVFENDTPLWQHYCRHLATYPYLGQPT
ncbi:hypothetical protein V7S43_004213 [Phytophthora oleae]|uniref:Uncharacterized protein n=1 Tax=Phytophthora oleae TaxID=2107226 RepID=A0ABD3G1E2_9STRA